jgi:hypothetical protein
VSILYSPNPTTTPSGTTAAPVPTGYNYGDFYITSAGAITVANLNAGVLTFSNPTNSPGRISTTIPSLVGKNLILSKSYRTGDNVDFVPVAAQGGAASPLTGGVTTRIKTISISPALEIIILKEVEFAFLEVKSNL